MLRAKENADKCDGTIAETLEVEGSSILFHASLRGRKDAKENLMKPRSKHSPCLDDTQISTMKHDKHIPIDVEHSLFSDATFHNDVYAIFSKIHKFGSVECDDAIDDAHLDMNEKAANRFQSLDSLVGGEEAIETLLRSISIHPSYLEGVQKQNLKCDEPDLKLVATSKYSEQCGLTNYTEEFFNGCHGDVRNFSKFVSRTPEKHDNVITPFPPQESFVTPGRERTRNPFESTCKNLPDIQEPRMAKIKNNDCNQTMREGSSILSQSCTHANSSKVKSDNHLHGTVEYLEQNSFATAQIHQKLDIPFQSEDTFMDHNEQIAIPSDSIKNYPNHRDELQESDKSNSQSSIKMDSASSPISEPCLSETLSEFGTKNHNRTQSCGSLDSSHIDIFNNIHLEELDACLRAASLLGSQDNSD